MNDRFAIIDIGSNSVRYQEACKGAHGTVFSPKKLLTTRLASGQAADGSLDAKRLIDTISAIRFFADEARGQGLPILAYATSAVRESRNRAEFLSLASDVAGVDVRILSGEEEGRFAYLGATGGNGTLIDIGGGSFQIVTALASVSFPIGCVRAKDRCPSDDPGLLRTQLFPWLESVCTLPHTVPSPVTGVGGTITTLGALLLDQTDFDGASLCNAIITPASLRALLDRLFRLGSARAEHPLLKRRHDVILQGGTILSYLMEELEIGALHPCSRDGMEGIAEDAFAQL